MMKLKLREELLFVEIALTNRGQTIHIPNVLVDTGSASTILDADLVYRVGISPESTDRVRWLRGIGGQESVYTRVVDKLAVGGFALQEFQIEIGEMSYGYGFGGILGLDFLLEAGAILDLPELLLKFTAPQDAH
jgi:Aspartyl protease